MTKLSDFAASLCHLRSDILQGCQQLRGMFSTLFIVIRDHRNICKGVSCPVKQLSLQLPLPVHIKNMIPVQPFHTHALN